MSDSINKMFKSPDDDIDGDNEEFLEVIESQPESSEFLLQLEEQQLSQVVNFPPNLIDPAPFQLVEMTSLNKVHSLFSLLTLSHAYVTSLGQLVGVVTLEDLSNAIQGKKSKPSPSPSPPQYELQQINEDIIIPSSDDIINNNEITML
jgi:chloride channel 2